MGFLCSFMFPAFTGMFTMFTGMYSAFPRMSLGIFPEIFLMCDVGINKTQH